MNQNPADNKCKDWKKEILEYGGISIIIITILVFGISIFARSCSEMKNENVYIDTLKVSKINYFQISSKKLDTSFIALDKKIIDSLRVRTDSINSKIIQINKASSDLKEMQSETKESFRFYLTVIGFIFAIVGFFGFKSIFDTRQAAIDRAVFDAKEASIKEAEKVAKSEAKIIAEGVSKSEIPRLTKLETENYLSENLQKYVDKIENIVIKEYESRLSEIESNVNKLMHPESFNENERPQIFNKIGDTFKTLNSSVEKIKEEFSSYKNDELKKSIIEELKK